MFANGIRLFLMQVCIVMFFPLENKLICFKSKAEVVVKIHSVLFSDPWSRGTLQAHERRQPDAPPRVCDQATLPHCVGEAMCAAPLHCQRLAGSQGHLVGFGYRSKHSILSTPDSTRFHILQTYIFLTVVFFCKVQKQCGHWPYHLPWQV